MIIWFFFSGIALLLAYLGKPKNQLTKRFLIFQGLLIIWLSWFISFGSGNSTDHLTYLKWYNEYSNGNLIGLTDMIKNHINTIINNNKQTEIGYVFLNILFNKLGFNFIGFLFFYSIVVNTLIVKFIYKYPYPVFIILIFIGSTFYNQQANLVRQMMSVAIFLYSIKYIEKRNFLKYFITIFIASLFHISSLLLIPLYYILQIKIPKYILISFWLISLYIGYFGVNIFEYLNIYTPYYNAEINKLGRTAETAGLNPVFNIVLLIIIIFSTKKEYINGQNILFYIFYIGIIISNLVPLSFYFYRVSLYFTIITIIVIPMIPELINTSRIVQSFPKLKILKQIKYPILLFYITILFRKIFVINFYELGFKMHELFDIFK